jgi:hypothetical protein
MESKSCYDDLNTSRFVDKMEIFFVFFEKSFFLVHEFMLQVPMIVRDEKKSYQRIV